MDGLYSKNSSINQSIHLIMDNDSGYISNNLDLESNSDSLMDSSDTSTVNILKSFLPKPVYLSEDALLERPETNVLSVEIIKRAHSSQYGEAYSPEYINSSVKSEKPYPSMPSFSSFQTDTDFSDSSLVIPIADPIYFDLNTKVHSSPSINLPLNNKAIEESNPSFTSTKQTEDVIVTFKDNCQFIGFEESSIEKSVQRCAIFKRVSDGQQLTGKEVMESNVAVVEYKGKTEQSTTTEMFSNAPTQGKVMEDSAPTFELKCETEQYLVANISSIGVEISDLPETGSHKITINAFSGLESLCKSDGSNHKMGPSMLSEACVDNKSCLENNSEKVLSNVTNICTSLENITHPVGASKIICPRRTSSIRDKENISQPEVFKTPNKGVKRKFNESGSPDLFSDDDSSKLRPSLCLKIVEERFIHKLDHRLIKRVQKKLSGVPPPPDFIITKFTVDDMLKKLEENKSLFWSENSNSRTGSDSGENHILNDSKNSPIGYGGSILIEGSLEEATNKSFPEILHSRHHGLHHNRNKISEEIEYLCDKYAKRYIGVETQSTCCAVETKYSSPAKRKSMRQKWATKSPGRRLSHLAKRRITFSSANLQANSSSAASRARQILIDYRKLELLNHKKSPRKSPRKTPRKTPNKSPDQSRTPSSSAKKKLRMRFRLLSGDFKEVLPGPSSSIAGSKRALFQSPDNDNKFRSILSNSSTSSCSSFNSDLNSRGTKRSLFSSPNKIAGRSSLFPSPNKKSPPFKNVSSFEKRRNKDEIDDAALHAAKLFRSQSSDVMFCENEQKLNSSLSRVRSESALSLTDLSAAHKKKLQWAVYESLKMQNVNTTHPQFKTYASVLARVTRRLILSSNVRQEGGTSERMLRIARHNSFAVVKGKSVEEIMNEHNKNKAKLSKPQGYIAPEEYQRFQCRDSSMNKENALKDRSNTGDSMKNSTTHHNLLKPESRIDRIRKVINFEDNR